MSVGEHDRRLVEAQREVAAIREAVRHGNAVYAFGRTADLIEGLAAELAAVREEQDRLRDALADARKYVIAAHYAGWDSKRMTFAQAAVDCIDAALSVSVPDGQAAQQQNLGSPDGSVVKPDSLKEASE